MLSLRFADHHSLLSIATPSHHNINNHELPTFINPSFLVRHILRSIPQPIPHTSVITNSQTSLIPSFVRHIFRSIRQPIPAAYPPTAYLLFIVSRPATPYHINPGASPYPLIPLVSSIACDTPPPPSTHRKCQKHFGSRLTPPSTTTLTDTLLSTSASAPRLRSRTRAL